MSDKLSSPSTSSGSGKSPLSRQSGGNGNGDDPYLVFLRQPPKYLYSNESFEVELQLELPKGSRSPPSSLGANEIELVASVHHVATGRECGAEALLITQPSHIFIAVKGEGRRRKVTCMIRMDSIRRDQGASLELRFTPRQVSNPLARSLAGISTNAIRLVNYKIRLSMDEDWGPVWYKDEGGRDKSMEVFAAIYDKDGQLRTGEQIPLHLTLCYETIGDSPIRVSNQDKLRTLGATKIVIDKDTGKARIRFRVEDVSKNHQGQDFVLTVGTDPKAKGFKDIAPANTPPVNVRSKRNKRSRNQGGSRVGSDPGRRSSPMAERSRSEGFDDHDTSFEGADIPRLREAMKSVINWADEVVHGLYPLQWQVLGYAQHPDGTIDYSRPYHNMPNPNPCIDRVLGMYSDTVRESLRVLLRAVEDATPRTDDTAPYMTMPMAAPLPGVPAEDMYLMRSPPGGLASRVGMHGSGQEPFRENPQHEQHLYPPRATHPNMHQPPPPPLHAYLRPENEMMSMRPALPPRREMVPLLAAPELHMQRSHVLPEEDSRESEVEYVLAKQYKALRTGERLGFPAYNANKEILGFYQDAGGGMRIRPFSPISRHRNDFGPLEISQATAILEEAIAKKSRAVYALKDWGSIASLLDHALVYDWGKDIGGSVSQPGSTV